jgi:hypothetical protein
MSEQSFVSVCCVRYVSTDNFLMCICEVKLVYVMECDLVYEYFEGFYPKHAC